MRKTIEVETLKNRINKYLSSSTLTQLEKSALAHILETVLHDTDNYKGFRYLFDFNGMTKLEAESIKYNREYF